MRKIYVKNEKLGECFFIQEVEPNGYSRRALFKCMCGKLFTSQINNVKARKQVSCGCKKVLNASILNRSHGLTYKDGKKRSEYMAYHTMIRRCYNEKDYHYKWYGARGITVCDRWKNSFENFIEDMGFKPDEKLSLDRTDNNLGYSKENCKWVTHKEQCNNRRSNLKNKAIN